MNESQNQILSGAREYVTEIFQKKVAPLFIFHNLKVDSIVYTLISNGTIVAISKNDTGLASTEYPFWGTGKNDFETLYYDSTAKGLILLCKSCEVDKGKKLRKLIQQFIKN